MCKPASYKQTTLYMNTAHTAIALTITEVEMRRYIGTSIPSSIGTSIPSKIVHSTIVILMNQTSKSLIQA